MRTIRQLNKADFNEYVAISANAYPGMKITTAEDRQNRRSRLEWMNEEPTIHFHGLFQEEQRGQERCLGVMRFHDFTMKLLSTKTLVGGLGGVAVDLMHKKEKVARDMILYFLHHYRDKGACLAALYPFRHDFYKKMGFGHGSKMNQYRIDPASLPRGKTKTHIKSLNKTDMAALNDCYNRFLDKTHGLMEKDALILSKVFDSPAFKVVGVKQEGRISGYVIFTFRLLEANNFLRHEMVIREFVYETPAALQELLTFLHSQADQVERIEFNTQDESFYHLLADPRNDSDRLLPSVWHESNTQGVGIMYRVLDVNRLFEVLKEHDFGGQSCRLKLTVADSFLPENAGSTTIHFKNGRPLLQPDEAHDVEIHMDISSFSSMVMGCVDFERLYTYSQARISDASYIETVSDLFRTRHKPICLTAF